MHELSIANSLVESVAEAAQQAGAARVVAVHLRLGALSGVERDALEFCYDIASRGTLSSEPKNRALSRSVSPASVFTR